MFRLHLCEQSTSTNDEIAVAIQEGQPAGLAVLAFEQSAGHGRQGRRWESPEGGLYLSLLLQPDVSAESLPGLSLLVGLVVRDACASFVPAFRAKHILVKWPNDCVLAQDNALCKLAGINLWAHSDKVGIGIGVNVFSPEAHLPDLGKNKAVFLAQLIDEQSTFNSSSDIFPYLKENDRALITNGKRAFIVRLAACILKSFQEAYGQWCHEGFAPFADAYNAKHALAGCTVKLADIYEKTITQGKVAGVCADGALRICDASGASKKVFSGEVHLL